MKATVSSELFTDLSTEQSAMVQGGCHRHRRSYQPTYYYAPRRTYSYYPSYNYGYSGGYGGSSGSARSNAGSVNQVVNVNVRYED